MPKSIFVLLVEDDPDDVLLIREEISKLGISALSLKNVDYLAKGLDFLAEHEVDVVLLDLNLPDSTGLETVVRVKREHPTVPVVVLTGLDDEAFSIEVVQAGAQDYLVKGDVTLPLLVHSMRYAIERQRLLEELEIARQREYEARELASIEQISRSSQTTVTEQTFGVLSLRESSPEFFDTLVQHFEQILDQALEQRVIRVEYHIEYELRNMAEQLGSVKASPRDVIDIYLRALKTLSHGAKPQKAQAYTEEGRFLVLELMGDLVSFYRRYFTRRHCIQIADTDLEE